MQNVTSSPRQDSNASEYLLSTFNESLEIKKNFFNEHEKDILKAAELIGNTVNKGGKVLLFGNGGSASDAQHMAAEMVGRMLLERRPLAAIALTTDTS